MPFNENSVVAVANLIVAFQISVQIDEHRRPSERLLHIMARIVQELNEEGCKCKQSNYQFMLFYRRRRCLFDAYFAEARFAKCGSK